LKKKADKWLTGTTGFLCIGKTNETILLNVKCRLTYNRGGNIVTHCQWMYVMDT